MEQETPTPAVEKTPVIPPVSTVVTGTPGDPTPTTTSGYALDAESRVVIVEYPDSKFKLRHTFVGSADEKELVRYYLAAPALKSRSRGEVQFIGTPSSPAAILHDETCKGLEQLAMDGTVTRVFTLEEVRELRQSYKADGIVGWLSMYDVDLETESGDLDDLLFDRSVVLKATVKTRPDGNKVESTFTIFVNRPNDLDQERFVKLSSSDSIVDEERDEILSEFVGEDNLDTMTGDEDEGARVAFVKTTQHVRMFFQTFNDNFEGAEDATFNGAAYSPQSRNSVLGKMDPVLKIAVAAAIRNFT